MLIWSRWGIVAVLLAALGVGAGVLIQAGFQAAGIASHSHQSANPFAGLGLMIGGGYIWLFDRYVLTRHLDKPRLYNQTFPLDQPRALADGTVQTHFQHPVQIQPRSTLFFVPFKYWSIVLTAIGGVLTVINVVHLAT
jgi:hypothetical protein